jgi:hypothetical protein
MALGLTQPLTERVPEIFPGGKGSQCVGLTTLPPLCANCLEIGDPRGLSRLVMDFLYLFASSTVNGVKCTRHSSEATQNAA